MKLSNIFKHLYFQSNIYKNKRGELNDLRAEYGVLSRTLEILQSRDESLKAAISAVEAEKGISGYRDTKQGNLNFEFTSMLQELLIISLLQNDFLF